MALNVMFTHSEHVLKRRAAIYIILFYTFKHKFLRRILIKI